MKISVGYALAVINGEFTIKTLAKSKSGIPRLLPANKD